MQLKTDKYKRSRGGHSRMLALSCEHCGKQLCHYQKDGPGILKRLYVDRMHPAPKAKQLICPKCKTLLGILTIYKKENRPAYRLFAGAINKKIIRLAKIK